MSPIEVPFSAECPGDQNCSELSREQDLQHSARVIAQAVIWEVRVQEGCVEEVCFREIRIQEDVTLQEIVDIRSHAVRSDPPDSAR